MIIKEYAHVYLVGIGGISVSAIAKLFLHHHVRVSGFDVAQSAITDELLGLGAAVVTGDLTAKVPQDVDLLVYSEAVPEDDRLRAQAGARTIKQMPAAGFWGEFSKDKKVIAISGTNGKSTTTTMVGLMLEQAGYDPTVVVGTRVLQWDSNIRIGSSDWLVIEADEYAAKMLNYKPYIAVITNISADHLDFYKDVDDIISHFQTWINAMPAGGTVVLNRDDEHSKKLSVPAGKKRVFGINGTTGVRAVGITVVTDHTGWGGNTGFNIADNDLDWGSADMRIPGAHNIQNAVAAAVAADSAGVPRKKILKALSAFKGTWRRFEVVGEYNKALIVSDYAHHPEGIRAMLKAAREWYPFRRIIVLFQPHHHNRTKELFGDFAVSFGKADEVIISEIYDVSGREEEGDQNVSSKDLVEAVKKSSNIPVSYAPDVDAAEFALKEKIKPNDVVIIMGAGDIDRVARAITK